MNENWVLLALIAAVTAVRLTRLHLDAARKKRTDQAAADKAYAIAAVAARERAVPEKPPEARP